MTNAKKIGWVIGYDAMANWRLKPISDRKNGDVEVIPPGDKDYNCPIKAFEEHFGEEFKLSDKEKHNDPT